MVWYCMPSLPTSSSERAHHLPQSYVEVKYRCSQSVPMKVVVLIRTVHKMKVQLGPCGLDFTQILDSTQDRTAKSDTFCANKLATIATIQQTQTYCTRTVSTEEQAVSPAPALSQYSRPSSTVPFCFCLYPTVRTVPVLYCTPSVQCSFYAQVGH